MATPIIMPRQGQSVESCIIAKWHKQKGDRVETGDILFSYETDKASFEEEAKVVGTLLDIFYEEGDDVPCLNNVCVVGAEGESTAEFNPKAGKTEPAAAVAGIDVNKPGSIQDQVPTQGQTTSQGQISIQPVSAQAPAVDADSMRISPRARNLAEKAGVDYRYASPSGPYGRIIEKDIEALREAGTVFTSPAREENLKGQAAKAPAGTGLGGRVTTGDLNNGTAGAAPETTAAPCKEFVGPLYDEVKIPNIRKVIAKAMHNSLASTAQLTLNSTFDATEILEFRKKLKAGKERLGLENITINDIIIYAVSRTLPEHKDLNAHFLDDRMLYFRNVNVGVAVDTDRGLIVPTVMNANLKSLNEISAEVKKLVKDCQAGTINPDLTKNGSFTITNLGTLDIESFTPILNPPQTGILGVNSIVQRAKEVDGELVYYPAMGLSLTFDHRAVDGAPAAKFLKDLKNNLENFSALLVR